MLGRLIDTLDDPQVASDVAAALGDPALIERLTAAAEATGRPAASIMTAAVRGFLDTASDDHWLQLIGIMNRAEDPGLAALRTILANALPQTEKR